MNETLDITTTRGSQKFANSATGKRGRKPTAQSRAAEIRGKLAAWKQTPESARPSLRVLARLIGTSHQLLSHYLERWERWQATEHRRAARQIRARAETENRPVTPLEERDAKAHDLAAFRLESILREHLKRLQLDAKTGQLNKVQVKVLRLFASRGYGEAQRILEGIGQKQSESNLPLTSARAGKSFRCSESVADNSPKIPSSARPVKTEKIGRNEAPCHRVKRR